MKKSNKDGLVSITAVQVCYTLNVYNVQVHLILGSDREWAYIYYATNADLY